MTSHANKPGRLLHDSIMSNVGSRFVRGRLRNSGWPECTVYQGRSSAGICEAQTDSHPSTSYPTSYIHTVAVLFSFGFANSWSDCLFGLAITMVEVHDS